MKLTKTLLLALLVLTPFLAAPSMFARAENGDDDIVVEAALDDEDGDEEVVFVEEEEAVEEPQDQVEFSILFPYHQDKVFPAGAIITAFIGVNNKGDNPVVVNLLQGSLRHPQELSQVFQNFSTIHLADVVEGGQHATFMYKFRPSERFEPQPFGLVVDVGFTGEAQAQHFESAYNSTVQIAEEEYEFDLGTTVFYAVAGLAAAYFVFNNVLGGDSTKPAKAAAAQAEAPVETGTRRTSSTSGNQWLDNANIPSSGGKSVRK
jgi:translocon-associated protein subunit alpha